MPTVVPEPAPVVVPAEPQIQEVAESPVDEIKQRLGEGIYKGVMGMFEKDEPRWGKFTGIFIELINIERLQNIVEDEERLKAKILEDNRFYEEHISRATSDSAQKKGASPPLFFFPLSKSFFHSRSVGIVCEKPPSLPLFVFRQRV